MPARVNVQDRVERRGREEERVAGDDFIALKFHLGAGISGPYFRFSATGAEEEGSKSKDRRVQRSAHGDDKFSPMTRRSFALRRRERAVLLLPERFPSRFREARR